MKNINKYLIYIIILSCSLISCKNEKQKKVFYKNGELKTLNRFINNQNTIVEDYDVLGNLKLKTFYTKKNKDSSIFYYNNGRHKFIKTYSGNGTYSREFNKNGDLEQKGIYIEDTLKIGWWIFYKKGKIEAKREYMPICETYYLNQAIILDKNQDTIIKKDKVYNSSTYYFIKKELTKTENKTHTFKLSYDVKSMFVKNQLQLILLKSSYCIEDPDTIISLNTNKGNVFLNNKYLNCRGFFFDYYVEKNKSNKEKPYNMMHHKKYFDLAKIN